ncbi:MAG: PIN domain-containing protein [Acidobacteria bacterium]|jgi:toxin-antitoxin system PIN domain toxin|nr:PIN domain-containing protein [Acidobacteriota bacterium]
MKLLDVNVWLAASWGRHAHHSIAKRWMDQEDDDLAFCRVTEMAFLRLVSNPAVTGTDVQTRKQGWDLLLALQDDPRVRFLGEPRGLAPVWITLSKRNDKSHLLWTDDYLAAFAQSAPATLVTLDRKIRTRYPSVDVLALA